MKKSKSFYQLYTDPETNIEYRITYHYEGSYYLATREEPAEYPELFVDEIYRTDNNQEIDLGKQEDSFEAAVLEYLENNHESNDEPDCND
jgi:hypothetical protein